jgi:hypothetical protein
MAIGNHQRPELKRRGGEGLYKLPLSCSVYLEVEASVGPSNLVNCKRIKLDLCTHMVKVKDMP